MTPYLFFDGTCEAAFTRYQQVLGGKITAMMRASEAPPGMPMPEGWQDKIMHACLEVDGRPLMGGDAPPGRYQAPQGFCVHLALPSVAEAKRVFAALLEGGGTIRMPLEQTFFATRFGLLADQFGIPWMVYHVPTPA